MESNRKKVVHGENISFLAGFLFKNPGSTSGDCRRALCENNGIEWTNGTEMRGQYTTYFNAGWIGGKSWPRNPCGRYWRRAKRPDGKSGYILTLEGLWKLKLKLKE